MRVRMSSGSEPSSGTGKLLIVSTPPVSHASAGTLIKRGSHEPPNAAMIRGMSPTRRFTSFCTAVAASGLLTAVPAVAQDQQTDIARELAGPRAEVRQLRAEVDELKAAAAAVVPPSVEMVQTQ